MKRGTIKRFREYLNKKFADEPKWRHNQYRQTKRGYGDYLYFQDRVKFDVVLIEVLSGNRPEDKDFLRINGGGAMKKELPEGFYANPFDLSFDTKKQIICIMDKIDKILEFLRNKEKEGWT